jgi:phosphoribosyl 1,2-cyclic phosphate phosphodiesterase
LKQPLEITILGTGTSQGIPVIGCTCATCTSSEPRDQRLRTAAFVKCGSTGIAIDIGPDFRRQMLDNKISDVHAVLLTHEHNDHISGLDDIRPINFLYQRNIPLYGHERSLSEMKRRFIYAFDESYEYAAKPKVTPIVMPSNPFRIGQCEIIPLLIDHGDMPIFGFRIGDFAYITDAKTIPPESMALLKGLDVLILNALRHKPHETHLNIDEAVAIAQILKPRKTYFTHISHEAGTHQQLCAALPDNIRPGHDGLRIRV